MFLNGKVRLEFADHGDRKGAPELARSVKQSVAKAPTTLLRLPSPDASFRYERKADMSARTRKDPISGLEPL